MEKVPGLRVPVFCLLFFLFLSTSLDGYSHARTDGSAKSSVFSLFNLKQRSRYWTDSVLHSGFDDLEDPTFDSAGILNYTHAGNLANYLGLSEVSSIYIPVPINFIFIGFNGKGNHEFMLNPEELERWFTKIDHMYEHTRIPRKDDAYTDPPPYETRGDRTQHERSPVFTKISYNFSVHAVEMGEKVASVVEHAINVLARKDDPFNSSIDEDTLWQVDVEIMDVLFSSLIEHLKLDDAYNILVLNPKHERKRGKYGYRRGLSESEIDFIRQNRDLITDSVQFQKKSNEDLFSFKFNLMAKKPLFENHPMETFSWTAIEETHTVEWFERCMAGLDKIEKRYHGKNTTSSAAVLDRLLNAKNEDMRSQVEKGLKSGDLTSLHAECLTDLWIGNDRWAFMDLSAGPFSWGPVFGGEGVRTEHSLPSVFKAVGQIEEPSEQEAEDGLQAAIQDRFSVLGNEDHEPIDVLLSEIDVYELFAFKHCKGRRARLPLCEELDGRMRDLKTELRSFDGGGHKTKAAEALRKIERWDLFGDERDGESRNYTVARDSFLSHLGSVLSGSMRHVVAPSISEGSFVHYEKVSFQLFFITPERVDDVRKLPVDVKSVTGGLSSLLLPSQKAAFTTRALSLTDDAALAMAFSVARRAASIATLLVNGSYNLATRTYLDSSILRRQLRRPDVRESRSTLEVPVFWFIHAGDPLLVDLHYQARSLADAVVVVQSESGSFESALQCDGRSILLDLRDPVRAALAAVSELLAGLLPLHLGCTRSHASAVEDWMWSTGSSPFSVTTRGRRLSRFQSDTMARSYIVTTLLDSVRDANSAVGMLFAEHTATAASVKTFEIFRTRERELLSRYNHVVGLWRRVAVSTGQLRYSDALNLLDAVQASSTAFLHYANRTVESLHPINCRRETRIDVEFDAATVPAFLFVGIILWLLLKPSRPKPKIN